MMRAIHIAAATLLGMTSLSMVASTLPAGADALVFGLTFAKVMIVLLVFAELRHAGRSWQIAFGSYFVAVIGCLFLLHRLIGIGG